MFNLEFILRIIVLHVFIIWLTCGYIGWGFIIYKAKEEEKFSETLRYCLLFTCLGCLTFWWVVKHDLPLKGWRFW